MAKRKTRSLERRNSERFPAPTDTFCYVKIQGNKVVGPFRVQNLSRGGATLILDHGMSRERVQMVQLFNKVRQRWSEHRIQVAYLFLLPRAFTVGVTFDRDLSEDEVQEFL